MFEHVPFGRHLKLSVRGASHAPALSFRLENLPAGFRVDREQLAAFMARRAPGMDILSTQRREADALQFSSGLDARDVTDGTPICGTIANTDIRPGDYGAERTIPRPNHADFGQWIQEGRIPTGGGANSGRLTACLCAAGGILRQVLAQRGIAVDAKIAEIGGRTEDFEKTIDVARRAGDSVGGVVTCSVTNFPAGIGGALFAGLESELAAALFAIPGVKGVSFGNGFDAARLTGSANNDAFAVAAGKIATTTNRHGGILGGRSSGMPIAFSVAFKPTPTIFKPQPSVDLATDEEAVCQMKGRHDPCIVRRAVPVVEAIAAFALADALLATEQATPRICLTLTGKTLDEDFAQFVSARYFTDVVELRVDLLEASERARAAEFPARLPVPVILTFRRQRDGGAYAGDEEARKTFFRETLAAAKKPFAFVDFEDDFRVSELTQSAHAAGTRIIRSHHDFAGPIRDMPAFCRALRGATDEIPKVAFMPRTLDDVTALFAETADFTDIPHIVCAMGSLGCASRVLAARTHSFLTYASLGGLGSIGHITPHELVKTYRHRVQTPDFALFAVTGWPLAHTRSPEIHNAAFAAADVDAVMVPIPAATAEDALRFFRALKLRGMAVTIPHKQAIMPLLDEIAPEARAIGAVNTVVVRGKRLVGHNTDAAGFAQALTHFLACETLVGKSVAVLGAGGAAKAVVYALGQLQADEIKVFHRACPPKPFDVIVNATPVDPIPDYVFTGKEAVYDLVYVPAETPLMARARAAGCRVENGFSMLCAQAERQRALWLGYDIRPSCE